MGRPVRADSIPDTWVKDAVEIIFTLKRTTLAGPLTSVTPLPIADGRIELGIGTFVAARVPPDTLINKV